MITYSEPRCIIFSITPSCTPPYPSSSSDWAGCHVLGCQVRVALNRKCVHFKRREAAGFSGWTSLMKWLCVIYNPLLKGFIGCVCKSVWMCMCRCMCMAFCPCACAFLSMCDVFSVYVSVCTEVTIMPCLFYCWAAFYRPGLYDMYLEQLVSRYIGSL